MSLKLVIFDMDGLMYDTEPIGMKCMLEAALQHGYEIDKEFALNSIGMNVNDHRKLVLEKFGPDYPYDKISLQSRKMRMDYLLENGITVKPGLKELISYLKQKNILIAIASSSKRETIDTYNKLANLDASLFDYIISGDKVEHSKPSPDIYLKVLEHLHINNEEALVLEDSRNGILAASNAKIKVICVPDLVKHGDDINKLLYKTVPSLNEVIDEVEKLL